MTTKYAYFKNRIVPIEEALVSVTTPAYRYGASVFEGLRAYWNQGKNELFVFRAQEHRMRLVQSALLMQMKGVSTLLEKLDQDIVEVLRANNVREDVHIVPSVFVDGDGQIGSVEPIGLSIIVRPRGRLNRFESGLRCCISSWRRISDTSMPPRIKCAANYQNSRLATLEAKANGYDNAIMLNQQGKVSEAPGGCVFIVRQGRLITPSVTNNILESITRDTIISIGKEILGLSVEERDIDRTELYIADEVFICGTNYEVMPVKQIDAYEINGGKIGRITSKLQEVYMSIVRGDDNNYDKWLLGVY